METVVEGETGVFFEHQSIESIKNAVNRFEKSTFFPELIRKNALQFSNEKFTSTFKSFVEAEVIKFNQKNNCK